MLLELVRRSRNSFSIGSLPLGELEDMAVGKLRPGELLFFRICLLDVSFFFLIFLRLLIELPGTCEIFLSCIRGLNLLWSRESLL